MSTHGSQTSLFQHTGEIHFRRGCSLVQKLGSRKPKLLLALTIWQAVPSLRKKKKHPNTQVMNNASIYWLQYWLLCATGLYNHNRNINKILLLHHCSSAFKGCIHQTEERFVGPVFFVFFFPVEVFPVLGSPSKNLGETVQVSEITGSPMALITKFDPMQCLGTN